MKVCEWNEDGQLRKTENEMEYDSVYDDYTISHQ